MIELQNVVLCQGILQFFSRDRVLRLFRYRAVHCKMEQFLETTLSDLGITENHKKRKMRETLHTVCVV